jgi:peroxiredoxin
VLNNQDGEAVTLSSFQGKSPVVMFFYPKAGTPGCTAEACAFRGARVFCCNVIWYLVLISMCAQC